MNHMGSNDWMDCDEGEVIVAANSPIAQQVDVSIWCSRAVRKGFEQTRPQPRVSVQASIRVEEAAVAVAGFVEA